MSNRILDRDNVAIATYGKCAARIGANGKSADDADWFSEASQTLYLDKPGTVLFTLTDIGDERLCQRYASGEVKPSAYFFRRLLRSPHGWEWLSIAMDGSQEQWWLDCKQGLKLKRAIEGISNGSGRPTEISAMDSRAK
jgi:hypothetical protein